MSAETFSARLLHWFATHGRHDLPWQHPRDAYRVWISEVMLQQTQVATVIPYFDRFLDHFPDVPALAQAPLDEVLRHWAGLGYYARARNLHRAAQQIARQHGGVFPQRFEDVSALPGIGRSTAGAILAQAYGQRHAILDGNARRVLARHAGIEGWPGLPKVQARLWDAAEARLPNTRLIDYTQAMMDLGNLTCRARAPRCANCPVREDCVALAHDRVAALPAPRPKRERPRRKADVLLIENAQAEVLIERRPPAGIWGGLWCLPIIDAAQDWREHAQRIGADSNGAHALPVLRHAFTHYDLDLHPQHLRGIGSVDSIADTVGRAWIKLVDPESWPGLPAPIRKLLQSVRAPRTLEWNLAPAPPCPAPSTASSSARKPTALIARPIPARSASASSKASPKKRGNSGSSTRRG